MKDFRQKSLSVELTRELQNSPAEQAALVLVRCHEKLSASPQYAQEWTKLSASINVAHCALLESKDFKIILKFDHELRNLALRLEHAMLPTAKSLQALS